MCLTVRSLAARCGHLGKSGLRCVQLPESVIKEKGISFLPPFLLLVVWNTGVMAGAEAAFQNHEAILGMMAEQ